MVERGSCGGRSSNRQILVAVLAQQRTRHCFGCCRNHCVAVRDAAVATAAEAVTSLSLGQYGDKYLTVLVCDDHNDICCHCHHHICHHYHHCCCHNRQRACRRARASPPTASAAAAAASGRSAAPSGSAARAVGDQGKRQEVQLSRFFHRGLCKLEFMEFHLTGNWVLLS